MLPKVLRLPISTRRTQAGLVAMSSALRSVSRGGTDESVLDVGVALAAHAAGRR